MFICFLFSQSLFSQELKVKRASSAHFKEEYTVLKENKRIKHGQYLKIRLNVFGNKSIAEVGQFEYGEKAGHWFEFTANGYLSSEGQYVNGLHSGLWRFYYEPIDENPTIGSLLSNNKGIVFQQDGSIDINKENLVVSSEGVFLSGRKTGAWNYYSNKGELIHKYNHNKKELLINNASDSLNHSYPFLGSVDRFLSLYYAAQEETLLSFPSADSKLIIAIKTSSTPISATLIEVHGDEGFAQIAFKSIQLVEENYITEFVDHPEGKIVMIAEFKIQNGRYILVTRFEQENSSYQ
jgi:hypothetical protein